MSIRRLISAALLAVLGATLALVATTGPASAAVAYSIKFRHSGKCIDIYQGVGPKIQQWTCARVIDPNIHNQSWEFIFNPAGDGFAKLQHAGTDACLDDVNSGTNGYPITLEPCAEAARWKGILRYPSNTSQPGPHWYSLYSSQTGKCIDMPHSSTANGTSLQTWDCVAGNRQQHLTWYQ